ncbi:MAG: sulfurtransferase TusA family protein [Conexivisphaerales archaeon]
MTTQNNPVKVLDTKGLLCPVPVLKTSAAIKEIQVGELLEVLATDPGSRPDLAAWARITGNELVSVEELNETPKVYRFLIRRLK